MTMSEYRETGHAFLRVGALAALALVLLILSAVALLVRGDRHDAA